MRDEARDGLGAAGANSAGTFEQRAASAHEIVDNHHMTIATFALFDGHDALVALADLDAHNGFETGRKGQVKSAGRASDTCRSQARNALMAGHAARTAQYDVHCVAMSSANAAPARTAYMRRRRETPRTRCRRPASARCAPTTTVWPFVVAVSKSRRSKSAFAARECRKFRSAVGHAPSAGRPRGHEQDSGAAIERARVSRDVCQLLLRTSVHTHRRGHHLALDIDALHGAGRKVRQQNAKRPGQIAACAGTVSRRAARQRSAPRWPVRGPRYGIDQRQLLENDGGRREVRQKRHCDRIDASYAGAHAPEPVRNAESRACRRTVTASHQLNSVNEEIWETVLEVIPVEGIAEHNGAKLATGGSWGRGNLGSSRTGSCSNTGAGGSGGSRWGCGRCGCRTGVVRARRRRLRRSGDAMSDSAHPRMEVEQDGAGILHRWRRAAVAAVPRGGRRRWMRQAAAAAAAAPSASADGD